MTPGGGGGTALQWHRADLPPSPPTSHRALTRHDSEGVVRGGEATRPALCGLRAAHVAGPGHAPSRAGSLSGLPQGRGARGDRAIEAQGEGDRAGARARARAGAGSSGRTEAVEAVAVPTGDHRSARRRRSARRAAGAAEPDRPNARRERLRSRRRVADSAVHRRLRPDHRARGWRRPEAAGGRDSA